MSRKLRGKACGMITEDRPANRRQAGSSLQTMVTLKQDKLTATVSIDCLTKMGNIKGTVSPV
jgi:hypothetical protein